MLSKEVLLPVVMLPGADNVDTVVVRSEAEVTVRLAGELEDEKGCSDWPVEAEVEEGRLEVTKVDPAEVIFTKLDVSVGTVEVKSFDEGDETVVTENA